NKFSNNLAVCSQSDRQGRTPLYYAAMSGNQDTVEFLLGLREVNHSLFNNYDVIRKLWNGLQTFPLSSDIKLLLELHHDGITPDNITILEPKHKQMLQEKGEAFVFKAIDSNQVDVLNGLIKNDCAPKTSKSLLYAIEKKNYDAIRVLANSEIINHRGSDGNMPLHYAVSRNDDNAVKILLSVPQIDCSLKNKAYQSALSIACQYCADTPQERRKNTTIIHALISGNNRSPVTIESVLEIIKNALTKENTDLMYAALKIYEDSLLNQSAMMEKSLQRIITHPTYKDCNDLSILKVYRYGLQRSLGVTPETGEINLTHGVRSEFLHIAVQYKLNVFLNALLDLDVNPNFQDAQGNTALMHAVFRNATDMVKSIGSRNTIDFFVKNKKNETVLDCAIITEKDEIIQLICSSLRAANVSLSLSDETHRSILDSAFNKKIDVLSEILSCFPEIDEEKFTAIIQGMQVGLPLEKILNGDVSSKDREQHSVNEYTLISATGDGYCGINSVNQFYYLMALYQPERLRSELFTETKFLSYLKKGLELDRTLIPKNDKKAFVDSLEQIKTGSDFKRFLETYYPCNSGRSLQKIERLLRLPALGVCCDLYRIFLETAHDDNLLNESSENEEYQKIAKLFGTDPDFLKNQKELFLYGEGLTLELDQNVVYGLQSDRNKDSLLKNQRIYQDRKNNKVNVDAYDIQKNQDLLDNAMTHNQSLPKIIESARYYNVTELMLLSAAFFKIERVQGDGGGVDYWMPLSPQSSPVAVKEINTHPPLGYLQNPSGGHWDFNIQQGIAKQIPHLTTQFENRASPSSTSSTKKRIYYNKSLDTTSAPHYNLQQNTAPLPLVMKIIGLVFAALLLVAVGYAGFVILRTITPMLYHAAISSISYGVQGAQNASFFVRQTIPKERVVSLAKSGYDIVKTYIPVISNGLHFAYHSLIKNLPTFVAVGAVSQKRKNI
ncbi:MAG: ankyrin repeat domain-containing protein, partial [Gammaproteobacteria bacterium]|nr:ankyrin repeat domain-containing protein [Gammaproteobacteria bacterium]